MRREIFAPMRSRKDGSVFSCRKSLLKDLIGKTALALLISLIVTGILMFAFMGPIAAHENAGHQGASPAANANGDKILSYANDPLTAKFVTALRL
jgi:hypothetical protein